MFFSKMKDKLTGSMSKFSGRTDFLEAVCAASALVASSDGEVTDDEIKTAVKVATANPTLASAFKTSAIEKTMDTMLRRAQAGRSGRMGLYKEIKDVASSDEMGEMVYLAALDIAESDGNVGDKERTALNEIAKTVNVDPKKYANV